MRRLTPLLLWCGMAAVATAAPAAHAGDHPWKKGSTVVITGCVEQAQEDDDEFVLTDVDEIPLMAARSSPPVPTERRVYWLDETDDIEDHVGSRVQVTARLKDVDEKEMEVERRKGTVSVKIKGDGDDIKVTPAQAGVTPPARGKNDKDVKFWLLELDVVNVEVVSETCRRAGTGDGTEAQGEGRTTGPVRPSPVPPIPLFLNPR